LGPFKSISEANGATVIDLIQPWWMLTEKNIESLPKKLSAIPEMEDTAILFDLFGNST
jgi:hypothetical protein